MLEILDNELFNSLKFSLPEIINDETNNETTKITGISIIIEIF